MRGLGYTTPAGHTNTWNRAYVLDPHFSTLLVNINGPSDPGEWFVILTFMRLDIKTNEWGRGWDGGQVRFRDMGSALSFVQKLDQTLKAEHVTPETLRQAFPELNIRWEHYFYQKPIREARQLVLELGGAINVWLDPKGIPHRCSGHAEGAAELLGKKLDPAHYFSQARALYQALFDRRWVRVAVQHDSKWLMVDYQLPMTRAQWDWVENKAVDDKLLIVNDQQQAIADYREARDAAKVVACNLLEDENEEEIRDYLDHATNWIAWVKANGFVSVYAPTMDVYKRKVQGPLGTFITLVYMSPEFDQETHKVKGDTLLIDTRLSGGVFHHYLRLQPIQLSAVYPEVVKVLETAQSLGQAMDALQVIAYNENQR